MPTVTSRLNGTVPQPSADITSEEYQRQHHHQHDNRNSDHVCLPVQSDGLGQNWLRRGRWPGCCSRSSKPCPRRQRLTAVSVSSSGALRPTDLPLTGNGCLSADWQTVEILGSSAIGLFVAKTISASYVERSNLSLRMASRRFTRLTNGFSKKLDHHCAAVSLYVAH